MPRPNPLTPEIQASFLGALRRGALVEAAAALVGVAVSTLYSRRKADPLFDLAWSAAMELSAGWAWDEALGRKVRAAGVKRRTRFGARRREAFLRVLERDCNTDRAARETGVNRSTVRRHLAGDPGFARSAGEALGRGVAALARSEDEARAAMKARLGRGELGREIEPKGEMTRDFDQQMRLLRRFERPDGTIGSRRVRHGRMRPMRFEDAIALLDRRLRSAGLVRDVPVEERMKGPGP
jgi:hypothetical protein